MEVGKEVGVDGILVGFVDGLDFDRLAEVHGGRFLDVQDRSIRNGNLSVPVSHIESKVPEKAFEKIP